MADRIQYRHLVGLTGSVVADGIQYGHLLWLAGPIVADGIQPLLESHVGSTGAILMAQPL